MPVLKIKLKNILVALVFVSQITLGQNKPIDLAQALENGTPSQVSALIKEGAPLSNTEKYLYKATLNSNIEYVKQNYKLLLSKGYKKSESEYFTAFYFAIDTNNNDVISFLTTQPEWNFKNNQARIFYIAYTELKENPLKEPAPLKTLIDLGIDLKSWHARQQIFKFAKECYRGYNEKEAIVAFKKFAAMGVNLNHTHPNGNNILHQAATYASDSIFRIFKAFDVDASLKNGNGKTADDIFLIRKITKSIQLEDFRKLDSLLAQVVAIDDEEYLNLVVNNASKNTVLKKFKTVMKYDYVPNTNHIREGDVELEHCLRIAIDSNAIDLMKYIFTLDESLQQEDKLNHFYASAVLSLNTFPEKNESTLQLLIDKGLDIHSVKNKESLLDIASELSGFGRQDTFRHFLSLYPVDLNFQDKGGLTILHHAAEYGNEEQFYFYSELGVDPTLKSNNGNTADELLNEVLIVRRVESRILGSIPYILFLFSSVTLFLSIFFRKKINSVFLRIIVSFLDTLSIFYILSTVFSILQDSKESALEIMFLFSVFGALVTLPLFFIFQYLIFRLLRPKKTIIQRL